MAFVIKQNDQRPYFRVQLTSNDAPVSLTGATSAKFIMKQGATTKVTATAQIIDAPNGIVQYAWAAADTNTAGTYNAEIEILWGTERQTFPSSGYFAITIEADLG